MDSKFKRFHFGVPYLTFLLVTILNCSSQAEHEKSDCVTLIDQKCSGYHGDDDGHHHHHHHHQHHHHHHHHHRYSKHLVKKNAVLMFSPPFPGTSGPVWMKDSITCMIDMIFMYGGDYDLWTRNSFGSL